METQTPVIRTIVTRPGLAYREQRLQAARHHAVGLRIVTVDQLAARLAGGFWEPPTWDALQEATRSAIKAGGLVEINKIANLPGVVRATISTLQKSWAANLDLSAMKESSDRIADLALVESRIAAELSPSMALPRQLITLAHSRLQHAARIFGLMDFIGVARLGTCWQGLVLALASELPVRWHAIPHDELKWLEGSKATIVRAAASEPEITAVTCADPRHEALEAMRWARNLLASGRATPAEIGIAATNIGAWDDHLYAAASVGDLPLHFSHGRRAVWFRSGQQCAALAEVLLHGVNRQRIVRLLRLVDGVAPSLKGLPCNWARALPPDAPLTKPEHWRWAFEGQPRARQREDGEQIRDHVLPIIDLLHRGPEAAEEAGSNLLGGEALAVWRDALREGPPEGISVALERARVRDPLEPGACIVWGHATDFEAAPRKYVRLLGLTSRGWPRRAQEDPLLPNHIVNSHRLVPVTLPQQDRLVFKALCKSAGAALVLSRSRRDSEGRLLGKSPLVPEALREEHLAREQIPSHAASEADRLQARPAEFAETPLASSSLTCWHHWAQREITAHDGLVRANHPALERAIARVHSATSLRKLLRDPLGFVWTYALGWTEPKLLDEPRSLDPLAFGSLVHAILAATVAGLELQDGGFGSASKEDLERATESATSKVAGSWELEFPVPPHVIWRQTLENARLLTNAALTMETDCVAGQRSWVEVPFGERDLGRTASAPWSLGTPVHIPGINISIAGIIDRVDLSADGQTARVTDYKTGRPPDAGANLQLNGGAELQRCLYSFAVRSLCPQVKNVEARLLYPRDIAGVYPLHDESATLNLLKEYLNVAQESALAGRTIPGKETESEHNDLLFALPANALGLYSDIKREAARTCIADLANLWERP